MYLINAEKTYKFKSNVMQCTHISNLAKTQITYRHSKTDRDIHVHICMIDTLLRILILCNKNSFNFIHCDSLIYCKLNINVAFHSDDI